MNLEITVNALQLILISIIAYMVINNRNNSRIVKRQLPLQDRGMPRGSIFPRAQLTTVTGDTVEIIRSDNPTITIFTSSGCPVCKTLYPIIEYNKAKYLNKINFVSLIVSSEQSLLEFIRANNVSTPVAHIHPYPGSLEEFNTKTFPFAYFLSSSGVILTKGAVLNEDLFSLLISEGLSMITMERKNAG